MSYFVRKISKSKWLSTASITDKIALDIQTKKYTKGDLKKLYNSAIESGIVSKPSLKEGISKELA